jgi:hypothetical protein
MSRFSDPLSRVRVASPCPADWDSMIGDQRVRFCGQCELKVYNLSAMTRNQAEDLICGTEGRLCIRFYRRRDGSILTQDCPVGLQRLKQRVSRIRKAIAAVLFGFFAGTGGTVAVWQVEKLVTDPNPDYTVVQGVVAERPEPIIPEATVPTFEVGRMVVERPVGHKKRRRP